MKPASAALVALLNGSEQFIMADLYTLTLQGGGVFRYSAAPTAITDTSTGRVFALGPKFERSKTKTVIGTQVDELNVKIYTEPTDLLGATPWLAAAWQGQLDGALLQLERAFMPAYGDTSPGTVVLFSGRVSDIDASRTGLDLKCRSHLELLNIQMPRRLYQPSCNHVFGDAMCQFDRSSLAIAVAAIAGSTSSIVRWSGSFPIIPFAQGTIIGLTGANAGQTRTITAVQSGPQATLKMAFLSPVAIGDTFQLLPGCDHMLATCQNIFNNLDHHGGFEFIPTPENAV
jgi:uncharacterized phage protein (TIGR02218 family)